MSKDIKIILSGLDNAGKSSLLLSLKQMYDYEEEVKSLKPTIRIDYFQRNFLNLYLNFLDMGGQSKYRKQYISHPRYFDELDAILYLIDIQDEKNYVESVNYLESIISILNENSTDDFNHNINICFSKADNDRTPENREYEEEKISLISNIFENRFPNFKFNYHFSTIYSIFTISRLISDILNQISDHGVKFQPIIINFLNKYKILNICLFDETGLIIKEAVLEDSINILRSIEYESVISSHLNFSGMLRDENVEISKNVSIEKDFSHFQYQFQYPMPNEGIIENKHLYLSIIINNETDLQFESEIANFVNQIKNKLKDFF